MTGAGVFFLEGCGGVGVGGWDLGKKFKCVMGK